MIKIIDINGNVKVSIKSPSWSSITGGAQGDIPYFSSSNLPALLNKNTTATRYLSNTGVNNDPSWSQVNLANGVTGLLPTSNGGTGMSAAMGPIFTLFLIPAAISPTDSTTYYFGQSSNAPTTTATDNDYNVGYAFKVIGATITVSNNTVQGTTEISTLKLRNTTQATSTDIGDFTTDGTTTVSKNTPITGLNINVASGDSIAMEWRTPAWVTNPTTMLIRITLVCQLT